MHGIGCPIAFQLTVVERLNRVMAVRRSHRSIFSLKSWLFTPATTSETYVGAASFNNPDHVDIVIHDYRWRLGLADGERKYDDREKRLVALPAIAVPTITIAARRIAISFRKSVSSGLSQAGLATTFHRRPRTPSRKPSSTCRQVLICTSSEVLRIIVRRTSLTIKTSPSTNEEFPNRRKP